MKQTVRESVLYWIWLQRALGPGSAEVPRLLELFSTAQEIHSADRFDLLKAGISGRSVDALCRKSLEAAQKQAERCAKMGWVLTPEDEQYPEWLRHIFSPPLVLYGKGDLSPLNHSAMPAVGMVGTRHCTLYGETSAAAMAAGLAAVGCTIVSGGARGIDRAVHEGALYAGGHTVVVQACGLNVEYPLVNRALRRQILESGGAVVTEFLPDTKAFSGNFQIRNRLISGLARAVCVVEAPSISGALITARTARDQGRDVFVIPGRVTDTQSEGSHALIREGAALVTRPSDILQEYPSIASETIEQEADRGQKAYYEWRRKGGERPPAARAPEEPIPLPTTEPEGEPVPCPEQVSAKARSIYEFLCNNQPLAADAICEKMNITPGELFSAMTELELNQCVDSRPGKRYTVRKG